MVMLSFIKIISVYFKQTTHIYSAGPLYNPMIVVIKMLLYTQRLLPRGQDLGVDTLQ